MQATIAALFLMIKEFFSFKKVDIINKPTTDAIKDKHALKKASNYTEKIITIVDKYTDYFDKKDLRKYNSLKKKFLDNN